MANNTRFSADLTKRAHEWLDYINDKYPQEICDAIRSVIIYNPDFHYEAPAAVTRRIRLMDTDSVNALFAIDGEATVLNFASYKYPGGMFLDGSTAQEEALCHKSTLFPVLSAFDGSYYTPNRAELNRGLYTNRAILSKDILFEQPTGETKTASVLTCASPNWLTAQKYCRVSKSENNKVVRERLKWMNEVLAANEVSTFIAGAWGCGVFRQDPEFMAKAMIEELTYPQTLVFAIPKGRNYDAFDKVLKEIYYT